MTRVIMLTERPALVVPGQPEPYNPAVSRVLAPEGDGAVFGWYQSGNGDPSTIESTVGRKMAVHRYVDVSSGQTWPTSAHKALADAGRLLHFGFEGLKYDFNRSTDTAVQPLPDFDVIDSAGSRRVGWTYQAMMSDAFKPYWAGLWSRLKAFGHDVILDFQHEMEDTSYLYPNPSGEGPQFAKRTAAGSPEEFVACQRYLRKSAEAAGVTNAVWGQCYGGWSVGDTSVHATLRRYWAGPPELGGADMLMWDPYNNSSSNWRSLDTLVSRFSNAVDAGLFDAVDPAARSLPRGIAEFGCRPDTRRAAWLRAMPADAAKHPKIRYYNYFSSGSWGELHTSTYASDQQALRDAVLSDWFDPLDEYAGA